MDILTIISIGIGVIVAGLIVVLYKLGKIDAGSISTVGALIDSADVLINGKEVDLIMKYARIAVRTVEQMAKNGTISNDNEEKKETAVALVNEMCIKDNVDIDMELSDNLIEAAVHEMKH